jgi:hypothetical protein
VIGATIPGMPAILVGRSDRLAWGLTAAYLDDIDLYVEQLNPDNPEEYRTPDGWAEFETRREIIEIDGAAARHHHPARDGKRPGHPRQPFRLRHRHAARPCDEHGLDRPDRGKHLDPDRPEADARREPSKRRWRRAKISWPPPRT